MPELKVNCLVCGEPMRIFINDSEADGVACKCGQWLSEHQATALAAKDQRLAELESTAREKCARHKAEAHSAAADMIANQWNQLDRTAHWAAMTMHFQAIWENLKAFSDDYHTLANTEAEHRKDGDS